MVRRGLPILSRNAECDFQVDLGPFSGFRPSAGGWRLASESLKAEEKST